MKIKSPPSLALRGICSVTFDVADAKSPCFCASPEAPEEPADHQGRSRQSQTDKETQTVFIGAEDEQGRLSPDMTENTAVERTHRMEEDDAEHIKAETQTEADHVESTLDITCASDVDVVEEKEETTVLGQQQTTKESEHEPDVLSEQTGPGSAMSSCEPPVPATGDETMSTEGIGELDDGDADDDDDHVGIKTEKPGEAEEQVELNNEEAETAHEAAVDDNLEQSCSAEPDVDPSTTVCKDSEKAISQKRNERVQKRGSRSLRYLKVLQASVVTQLK